MPLQHETNPRAWHASALVLSPRARGARAGTARGTPKHHGRRFVMLPSGILSKPRRVPAPLLSAVVATGITVLVTLLVTTGTRTRDAGAQPGAQGELRAERLTIVGPDGAPRLQLGEATVAGLTGTGLVIYDQDGRTPRVAQGVTTGGQSGLVV